jgi:RNA polymerase sigma-70 factor (ECF subfamily)
MAGAAPSPRDEDALATRARAGDAAALGALVDALHGSLLRLAASWVGRGAAAEDLVQETWLAVVDHLGDFEGRSSVRTWIARILVNRAKTRRERERRFVPLEEEDDVDAAPGTSFSALGLWTRTPAHAGGPEAALLRKEASGWLVGALDALPPVQRSVVVLRDVEEWTSDEVCNALGLSESNQRVLLHRGRLRLRAALEAAVHGGEAPR